MTAQNNNNTNSNSITTMDMGYTYTAPVDEPLFRQSSLTNLAKLDSTVSSFYRVPAQALHKQLSAMDPSIFFLSTNDGSNNGNNNNNNVTTMTQSLPPQLFPSSSTATHRYYDDSSSYLELPIRDTAAAAAAAVVSRHQLQHAVHEHQQQQLQQQHHGQRYDSTDGTSIVTTDTDNDMTNSPSSSIPGLSPMHDVASPHSYLHHSASPFKHSAADVLTSEFALPPPMSQSSSACQQYESVGKLSRYITADDTTPSSIQTLPQYFQQNTILNHLSPGQRAINIQPHQQYVHKNNNNTSTAAATLPQSATQLANILRHHPSPQHVSSSLHRSPQIKHEAANATAVPAATLSSNTLSLPPAASVVKSHTSSSLASSSSAPQQHHQHIHPDDLPLRYHQHLNIPGALDQRLSSSSTQASHVSSSTHAAHHLPTYRAGTKTNNAHTMVLGPDGQLKQRRSRDGFHSSSTYNSPTLSAISVGSSNSATSSSGGSKRYSRPPSIHHTKGHLTTDMSHKYYYDEHDVEHSIRILTVTNHETHAVESFVHAADLGGVVERKSNISRLFGQFSSPAEKVLMNVTGTHNHSIGQESNVLTRAGVLRFFDCSKMRGQTQYREWVEDVILSIFDQNKSATVIENMDEIKQVLASQGTNAAIQSSQADAPSSLSTATTPTSTTRVSHKRSNSSSTAPIRRSSRHQPKRRKSRRLSSKDEDDDDDSSNESFSPSDDDSEDDETYRGR